MSSSEQQQRNQIYYCHICSRNFRDIELDYTCPLCHSGFVELVDYSRSPEQNVPVSGLATPLFNFFGQPQPQASTSAGLTPASNEQEQQQDQQPQNQQNAATAMPNTLPEIIRYLFQALSNNGNVQVHFQINDQNGVNMMLPLHGNAADYVWGPGGLDAVVTQLLNQVEGGAPPLSKDKIDSLPNVEISKAQVEKRLQCAVCMDEFKLTENVKKLVCDHVFHESCIVPWLERHNSCPVCRMCAETGLPPPESPMTPIAGAQSSTTPMQPPTGPPAATSAPSRQSQNSQWRDIDELD